MPCCLLALHLCVCFAAPDLQAQAGQAVGAAPEETPAQNFSQMDLISLLERREIVLTKMRELDLRLARQSRSQDQAQRALHAKELALIQEAIAARQQPGNDIPAARAQAEKPAVAEVEQPIDRPWPKV